MKRCYRCKESKPFEQFDKDPRRKDGHRGACRECGCALARAWYHKNKDKSRDTQRAWRKKNHAYHAERSKKWYHANKHRPEFKLMKRSAGLKTKYGIDHDTYLVMVEAQGGLCKLCGERPDELVVDHCHSTGCVRALLCDTCNRRIGMFGDDVDRLVAAIRYLHDHRPSYSEAS